MFTPNNSGRRSHAPEFIVIHWWGNPDFHRNGRPDGVVRHLCNPASQVSAHFVVAPDSITQLLPLDYIAWHARSANRRSIGIECWPWDNRSNPDAVKRCLANIATALRQCYKQYPHLKAVRLHPHCEHVQTDCPGPFYLNLLEDLRHRALNNTQDTPKNIERNPPKMLMLKCENDYFTTDGVYRRAIAHPSLLQKLSAAGVPCVEVSKEELWNWPRPAQEAWGYKNPQTSAGDMDAYKLLRLAAGLEN